MTTPFLIEEAVREQIPLVMLLMGVSGAGKTYTALAVASYMLDQNGPQPWMKDQIVVLDSDNGRSSRYASGKPFYFSMLRMTKFDPDTWCDAYAYAVGKGFKYIIIDSSSDEWQWILEESERMAKGERNKERIWGVLTPKHNRFLRTITNGAANVIVTALMKPHYETVEKDGKKQKVRQGNAPIQRDGVERLFDIAGVIEEGATIRFIKTLCSALAEQYIDKPGRDLALTIKAWLKEGEPHVPSSIAEMADILAPKLAMCTSPQEAEPLYNQLDVWCQKRNLAFDQAKLSVRSAAAELLKKQRAGADQSDAPPTPRPTQQSATNA